MNHGSYYSWIGQIVTTFEEGLHLSSNHTSTLYAYLSYKDALQAMHWLEQAFGFGVVTQQIAEDGKTVNHAEMRLGEAVIMLASNDQDYEIPPLKGRSTGCGIYIFVDEVQPLFAKAVTAGATVVFPPEKTEWGTERCRVLDPEGHEWSFGTYEPGHSW
jgi:uncharacterized glyoxalase superfamily protein PhnB